MATGFNADPSLVTLVPDKTETHTIVKLNSLATLGLLIALAIVLCWVSSRYSTVFDLTRGGRQSLTETTTKILSQLEGPIHITAYARETGDLRDSIRRYVSKYQSVKSDITLSFVNPESVPDRVRELGIRINGELVFEYQGRMQNVRVADESTITNALVRLSQTDRQWIVYISGHGERSLLGQANHDLGEFGKHLTNRGYHIQPINLAEVRTIPDNTTVLVLAGLQLPLLAGEITIITDYLHRGGNFLWLLDPDEKNIPEQFTDFFELDVASGTVIDIAGQLIGIEDPTITMITNSLYGSHPVVEDFEFTTLFPKATVLFPSDSDTWSTSPLLMTGSQAWLETGSLDGEVEFESDTDLQGPLTIGLALSRAGGNNVNSGQPTGMQKIIIIGDGDFVSNTYLANSGNLDLGMRFIDWLSDNIDLIEIPVRPANDTQLTVSSMIIGSIGIIFLIVLPLTFMITGLYIWWNRRRT